MVAVAVTGLEGDRVDLSEEVLERLSMSVDGPLLRRGDAGYDEVVRIWNGMIVRRPALVVQPVSVEGVKATVAFARAHGLLLSIKGGGHNIAGTSLADGALTLDMSRMKAVEVDPERRVVRVEAGCLLGEVDRATQGHGLATVLGFVSETGVAGLTLGGGFGYLSRRFGWTVDNLQEVEIVTADGETRRAAADEHEDLFWALRGGGGNFGVVTRFTFGLHAVGPTVTGGLILWAAERAEEIVARYRQVTESAPRELTLVLTMRLAPPAPFIAPEWHGKPIVGIAACHSGDPERAADDLAPIRAADGCIADQIVPKTYVQQQCMLDPTQPKGMHYYWKSEFVSRLADDLLDRFREQAAAIESPMSQMVLFQLGGAVGDVAPGTTAFGNRDAAYVLNAAGAWPPDTPDATRLREWVRTAWEAIRPYSTGGNYVNFQTADEDEGRTKEAYRDTLDRLASVKAAYDPDNLFRVNRNIRPVG